MNGCAVPSGIVAVGGVTAILTNAAGVTFSDAVPGVDPTAAVTVTVPTATLVASPAVPGASLTVAIAPFDELQ
jgi:hypothetical protein